MRRLLPLACRIAALAVAVRAGAGRQGPIFPRNPNWSCCTSPSKIRKGGYVGGLGQESFRVLEDRRPQEISFFNSQDAPVTVGLLIDCSGSMAPNRDHGDRGEHGVHQSDESAGRVLRAGVQRADPYASPAGKTVYQFASRCCALRSCRRSRRAGKQRFTTPLNAGLDYVQKGGFERQVLIVLSDGGDNASDTTRAQVLANAQASNAVIYTIALVDPMDPEADPGFLRQLSESTGGVAFRPKNASGDRRDSPARRARHPQHVHDRLRPVGRRRQRAGGQGRAAARRR